MGDAPHELKSGAPAAKTFVGGVLDSFTIGRSVDNETDVAAPVGVVRLERYILAHEIQVGTSAAWDLEEAFAPPLFAGDLRTVLREDGVEPVLEAERQVQA